MTDPAPRRLSRRTLLLTTVGAAAVAGFLVFAAVIPAEYGRDPTGLGRLTGLSRLWAPESRTAEAGAAARAVSQPAPFRSDVVEIPLTGLPGGREGFSLEYKVRMKRDAALVYAWEVIGADDASDMEFDFHGHTLPTRPDEAEVVAEYEKANGVRRAGSLVAPFDGVHGWYLQSWSETPVVVRLRLSGFYELVPAGADGNEAGIVANVPAAQARPDPLLRSRTQGQG